MRGNDLNMKPSNPLKTAYNIKKYMKPLNEKGQALAHNLRRHIDASVAKNAANVASEKINVVGAGGTLTAAYEQLRNAAENIEEHLLLQNAIRRFYRQLFITRDGELVARSGLELATELTLAGYLANDSLSKVQVDQISALALRYYSAYERIQSDRKIATDRASKWALDVLAVKVEQVINDHGHETVFTEFAYTQLSDTLDAKSTLGHETPDFGVLLYIAIYRALLKADEAVIRTTLLERYQVSVDSLQEYVGFNRRLDQLIDSAEADKLYHVVDRQGAPLRILRRMIDEHTDMSSLLDNRGAFLNEYENQVNKEYERVGRRINRAIVRSIIFLIITKFLIGLAIEIPYDLWAYGEIIWVPLIINLLFPPIYMFALRATHRLPGYANTTALIERIDAMLYGDSSTLSVMYARRRRSYGAVFSVMYVLLSIAVFALVMYGLLLLRFSLLHIAIFFVFLSAASFLGFRLSRLIRELEIGRSTQNGMTVLRDLLYLPFVVVGQWMSDKYSRVNIVTIVLDMLIELPLKTVLRLIRQWGAFIDDRKDRI